MSRPPVKTLAAIALALGMWFVPSLSTQGAGTVGRQLPHPDRLLVADGDPPIATPDAQLRGADAVVREALPR
jgi:hypothetical protein